METSATTGHSLGVFNSGCCSWRKSETSICVKSPEAVHNEKLLISLLTFSKKMAYPRNSLDSKIMQIYLRRNCYLGTKKEISLIICLFPDLEAGE